MQTHILRIRMSLGNLIYIVKYPRSKLHGQDAIEALQNRLRTQERYEITKEQQGHT
jgi:hypothetical protein